ncbi:MAG TPA: 3-hydroxyacyl-CoA dehydrogenase NAD-binding domain-containing protein [Myxococcaceae bacterium]|nr:3-hydroxyacyl-CoA dehydrogenase NAD-binding domain-containing protein [Myxococcaceae bacterium]
MKNRIRKVAVLGAGVMGSGIAAHVANAGLPVLLMDIVPPKAGPGEDPASRAFRNKLALGAVAAMKKHKPAPLFTATAADLIEPGNFEDDLPRLLECDWVVEAVKEDLAVKQALFSRVEPFLKSRALVSSNTSGLSVKGMCEGRGTAFRRSFLVTHFFNPPRYMKLLELVKGPDTTQEALAEMSHFAEEVLGKGVVFCKDTTNFIANRIGTYSMMKIFAEMQKAEMTVEEIDKIFGAPMGRPRSAVFRTADVVGLDTFLHVARNCYDTLTQDEERETFKPPAFLEEMVKRGMLGDKTGGGFYKKAKGQGGEPEILALDLKTLEYRPQQKVRYESLAAAKEEEETSERIAVMMTGTDKAARLAERATLEALAYASRRIPEIADDYVSIDRAVRWGFGWEMGPFETWDAYGVRRGVERMHELGLRPAQWVEDMLASGRDRFYGVDRTADTFWEIKAGAQWPVPDHPRRIRVEELMRAERKVLGNDSATAWDLGDGVMLLELHSKMNSIDGDVVSVMYKAVERAEQDFRGLVIGNDAENFSVGANLMALLMAVKSEDFESVRRMARDFQQANQRMRYSAVPVVAAPFGMALGGGAELAMGAHAIQASAELYMGLVEAGVGLIPGGGGTMQLLRNLYGPFSADKDFDPLPFIKKVFLSVGTAKVSTSAEEAREMGFLSRSDGISMSRDLLIADARARCIGIAESGFRPPRPTQFRLPGRSGRATVDMMLYDMQLNHQISEHDRKIGKHLATVLTGGDTSPGALVSEERMLELELEAFLSLCGEEKTQERVMYMLEKGKPLRN